MKISQNHITAFNAAYLNKSFSRAAKTLGVTQSSVTQNVAKFEALIGASLFERRRAGLVLTPAGRKIHAITEEIGLLFYFLEQRMSEYASLNTGTLRVAASAANPAMVYLGRFRQWFPGVDLSFSNASWRQCAEMLRNRDVDVAIMPEPENAASFHIRPIENRRLVALVHDGHPLFDREAVSMTDIAATSVILSGSRSFARWKLEERAVELHLKFENVTMVSSTPMAVEAVHHGLGITVTALGAATLYGNIRSIAISDLQETYRLVACCNREFQDLEIVRSFLHCIA